MQRRNRMRKRVVGKKRPAPFRHALEARQVPYPVGNLQQRAFAGKLGTAALGMGSPGRFGARIRRWSLDGLRRRSLLVAWPAHVSGRCSQRRRSQARILGHGRMHRQCDARRSSGQNQSHAQE